MAFLEQSKISTGELITDAFRELAGSRREIAIYLAKQL